MQLQEFLETPKFFAPREIFRSVLQFCIRKWHDSSNSWKWHHSYSGNFSNLEFWSFRVFEFSKKIFVKILILYQENIILQKVALFQKWLLILFIQLQLSTIQKCCFLLSFMESPANGTTMSKTGYPLMVCN